MLFRTLIATITASFLLVGCVSTPEQSPTVGGYSEVSTSDPEVNAAAQFAVSTHADDTGEVMELQHVIQAEQQVVAGMNYRLRLGVIEGGRSGTADAVVYRDPEGQYSLTSWVWDQNPEMDRPRR